MLKAVQACLDGCHDEQDCPWWYLVWNLTGLMVHSIGLGN